MDSLIPAKSLIFALVLPWLLLLWTPFAVEGSNTPSAKIYMSVKGSDLNPGSRESPVQTLSRAVELIREDLTSFMTPHTVVSWSSTTTGRTSPGVPTTALRESG